MPKYNTVEDIERLNQAPENETQEQRTKRLSRISSAKRRLILRQEKTLTESDISSKRKSRKEEEIPSLLFRTRSRITASITEKKRKSRAILIEEQKKTY